MTEEICGRCKKPKQIYVDLNGKDFLLTKASAAAIENAIDFICLCGRPTTYNPSFVGLVDVYLEDSQDGYQVYNRPHINKKGKPKDVAAVRYKVQLPTHEGFALMLGVNTTSLYEWAREYPEFSKALEKIKDVQKERLLNSGLSGEYNPAIAKLVLSANHGMRERSDVTSDDQKLSFGDFLDSIPK